MYLIQKLLLLAYLPLVALSLRYHFYKGKSKNKYVCPAWHSCCPCIAIFAIKKAKTAKNVLDKKVSTAGTPATALVLQFLQVEKRK